MPEPTGGHERTWACSRRRGPRLRHALALIIALVLGSVGAGTTTVSAATFTYDVPIPSCVGVLANEVAEEGVPHTADSRERRALSAAWAGDVSAKPQRRLWWTSRVLVLLAVAFATLLSAGTTPVRAPPYSYDDLASVRAETHQIEAAAASKTRHVESRLWSAFGPAGRRGTATTPDARSVATNTAPTFRGGARPGTRRL